MNLYHYTSQAGLLGILKSGGVWATDARFLNDATEIIHTIDEAKRMVGYIYVGDDYRAAFGFALRDALEKMDDEAVFVTSFSEHPDLLSQWRGYCPTGAGVCVGFAKEQIEEFCEHNGYGFANCIYDHKILHHLVADIVDRCERKLPAPRITRQEFEALTTEKSVEFATESFARLTGGDKEIEGVLREACDEIVALAPLFKNDGFREEAEWRIVASKPSSAPIQFRAGASYLCPYIEAKILDRKSTLQEVIVGPNPNQYRARPAIQMALSHGGFDNVEVVMSSLPFNNW